MTRLRFAGRRKALVFRLVFLLGVLLALAVLGTPAHAQATGQWQLTGSLATGHVNWYNSGFAQLPDGRVLAISGSSSPGTLTPAAEIYDPATGQWTSAGTLNDARYAFGPPSVLPDGDVLVAGGHDVNVVDYATAELYDPATNQWTRTGSLNTARRYPIQAELANGEVLVATGSLGAPTCTRYLSSAELYNPATGHWTYTGSTLVPRESATAIRLADGRVLLAGGYNGGGGACRDTDPVDTELYDPSTGHWSFAGNLPHGWLAGTMVLLSDGRVLLVDGYQTGSSAFAEAVIFDPATNQWSEAATPILPRAGRPGPGFPGQPAAKRDLRPRGQHLDA
jgi:N-acetylneuraminic acid mutarotase